MKSLFGFRTLRFAVWFTAVLMMAACKKDKQQDREELLLSAGSKASWKGYLENGYFNSGNIELSANGIFLENDKIVGGQVRIPVSSIVVTSELLSTEEKVALLAHLKTDAFFNLAVHPDVIYTISSAEKMAVDGQGNNYLIKGSMKLLGKELVLDIPAKIQISNASVKVDTKFSFDRTKWGMTYASSDDLPPADKIKNNIEVELSLNATRF